jgi:hypothetical protein
MHTMPMLHAFDRHKSAELPPLHRLVLVVLADVADERARVRLDRTTVAIVAKRTGLGVREVQALLRELRDAVWIESDLRQKGSASVYVVRLEGGRIVPRPLDAGAPPDEGAPGASPLSGVAAKPEPTAPLTLHALMQQRPADDLLGVLSRGVDQRHPWCMSTMQRMLERGGRLTENERKRLREISEESAAPRGPARRRFTSTSTLQTGGTWKPKGAPP